MKRPDSCPAISCLPDSRHLPRSGAIRRPTLNSDFPAESNSSTTFRLECRRDSKKFFGMKTCFPGSSVLCFCCFIPPSPALPHQQGLVPRREKTDRLSAQGAERPRRDKEGGGTSRSEEDKTCEIIHVQCERAGGGGWGEEKNEEGRRRREVKSRSEEMREQQWSGDKRGGEAAEREE